MSILKKQSDDKIHLKMLPTGKQHVSFSELSQWNNCSWAHRKAQIEKIDKYVQNVHASFGTAVHAALEDFLKTREMKVEIATDMIDKIWSESRDNPPKDLTEEQREEFLRNFTEKDIIKINSRSKKSKVIVQGQNTWKKQAIMILAEIPNFLDATFPSWEFVEAEHKLYEKIDGFDHAFKGYIDGVITCLDSRGKKRLTYLIDWKTSSMGWFKEKKQDPMTKTQLVLYKKFWSQKNPNIDIKNIRCAFIILKRIGKPGSLCDFFPVSVGDVTISRTIQLVRNMIVTLNRGIAVKNRYGCKWCDYFGTEHCDSIFKEI